MQKYKKSANLRRKGVKILKFCGFLGQSESKLGIFDYLCERFEIRSSLSRCGKVPTKNEKWVSRCGKVPTKNKNGCPDAGKGQMKMKSRFPDAGRGV